MGCADTRKYQSIASKWDFNLCLSPELSMSESALRRLVDGDTLPRRTKHKIMNFIDFMKLHRKSILQTDNNETQKIVYLDKITDSRMLFRGFKIKILFCL